MGRAHPKAKALIEVLEKRVDERNAIAHNFLPDRAEALMAPEGRRAAIRELRKAYGLPPDLPPYLQT